MSKDKLSGYENETWAAWAKRIADAADDAAAKTSSIGRSETWGEWAKRTAGGEYDGVDYVIMALYDSFAEAALDRWNSHREKAAFIKSCHESSIEFAKDSRACVAFLEVAEMLSGRDLIWLRTGVAAIRDEVESRKNKS